MGWYLLAFFIHIALSLALVSTESFGTLKRVQKWIAPLPGLGLATLSVLVVLPDVWVESGGTRALSLFLTGVLLIHLMDRFVAPICPECGGNRGFSAILTLLVPLGLHSVLDGALLAVSRPGSLASWTLILHRAPELLATVAVLRMAQKNSRWLMLQVGLLQLLTFLGFFAAARLNTKLLHECYAVAGGALLYLGCHSLHSGWFIHSETAASQ